MTDRWTDARHTKVIMLSHTLTILFNCGCSESVTHVKAFLYKTQDVSKGLGYFNGSNTPEVHRLFSLPLLSRSYFSTVLKRRLQI